MTKIIVSYDGTENDHDALALGRMLGDAGAKVALAYVRHTTDQGRREELAQHEAESLLERGAQWLGHPEVERHVIVSASTGEGLRFLAEQEGADIVVFGSDWHTTPGHVQPGRAAVRLLEGGPAAVAVAPARLRDRADATLSRVAVATGDVDPAAVATAHAFAGGAGLASPTSGGLDLLVIGSRAGTPEGHVRVSASSEYLIETATSTVLVVPRGVAVSIEAPVAVY